jgi:glycolate oxidase FAD binding subunit
MSVGISTVAASAPTDPVLAGWREQILDAGAARRTLVIRGGGSKAFYGRPVAGDPLDAAAYRGIVAYEPTELVITARCGTPLAEVEAALAERGQMLAFEPPRFAGRSTNGGERRPTPIIGGESGATPTIGGERRPTPTIGGERSPTPTIGGERSPTPTIGGVVAAGLSGPRRMAVGAVRDFVLGVRLMNGEGELLAFGGQVMKNVAGYDVSRMLTGSLGTLGVLAEVSLKVVPLPRAEATLRFELSERDALERLNRWGGQPLPVSASCWFDGRLTVRLSGAEAAVGAARAKLGGTRVDAGEAEAFWSGLRDQSHPFFATATDPLFRLALPDTAPAIALPAPQLIEWGGAQRWCVAPASQLSRMRDLAAAAAGHATLFRAAGSANADEVFMPLQPTLARIHRELKQAFDPAGVFNRGRMYRDI